MICIRNFINSLLNETKNNKVIWETDPSLSFNDNDVCRCTMFNNKIVVITKTVNHILPSYSITVKGTPIRGYSNEVKKIFRVLKL